MYFHQYCRNLVASLALVTAPTLHAGLVGWWKFDETSGTSAADSAALPANGTLTGGATFQPAAGRFGGAVYLNGTTGYVDMGDVAKLEFPAAQSFSLSCWYKPDGDESITEFQTNSGLISKGYHSGSGSPQYDVAGYYLMTVNWSGTGTTTSFFQFDSRQNSTNTTAFRFVTAYQAPDVVVNATWKHFVTVFDRVAGQARTYVDGTLYSTKAVTAGAGGGQWDMGVNTSPFIVGNHFARFTKGWFDDVGVWNHALTSTEITSIYNSGITLGNDTDSDGLVDTWETTNFGNLAQTASGDFDSDGLTNLQEQAAGTNPTLADTDGDGLSDNNELNVRLTNPLLADTDGDGLSDGAEVNTHLTNPLLADTDGDTFSDGAEITAGTNPLNAASFPPPPAYNVHINEFMANSSPKANDATAPLDMDGDSRDWIEIKNNEATSVNLQGYQLSDDPALLGKYTIPSFSIPAGSYALVYASGKNRAVNGVQPHTNFQLGGSGQLILSRPTPGGQVIVSQIGTALVPYPSQHRTISYGPADNLPVSAASYMTTPTPGAANSLGSVVTGFVADTTFTMKRGIYSTPFTTTIACPTPGATIVYTVNGSIPTLTNGTQISPADALTPPAGTVNISATTLIRARAFKTGLAPTDTDTQSYIFTADVLSQNAPTPSMNLAPGDTMTWGNTGATLTNLTAFPGLTVWGINTGLASDPVPDNVFVENDLKNIATISLVAPWKDLFGPNAGEGIYPPASGVAVEGVDRAASMEFINPDGSVASPNLANGFQADGNIHIFGGTSQGRWKNYKLSFRFQCLNDVNYRVFGNDGYNQFDNFVLDARMNNTWAHPDPAQGARGDYVNDQVVADLQNRVSGRGGFRSRPVHLYINGLYWGMYFMTEKPDHHFASAYYGGDSSLWDVFKHSMRPNFTESDPIVNATYANPALAIVKPSTGNPAGNSSVQANYEAFLDTVGQGYIAPNPTPDLTLQANYDAVAAKLDIDAFIDYMIVNFVAGNQDWSDKNLYASYYRGGGGKWRFHVWDAEHTFRTGAENFITANGNEVPSPGQPKPIHNALKVNAEYRLRFADRIRKHMFNTGPLTAPGLAGVFTEHLNRIDSAIRAESARWGHIRASVRPAPYTNVTYRKSDWSARKSILLSNEGNGNSLLQNRWNLVMQPSTGIFRTQSLYPTTEAPNFSQHGGAVAANYPLTITDPNGTGTIYYTLDGSDPRLTGGAVSGTAQTYTAPVALGSSGTVKSRVLLAGTWSALNEAYFSVGTVPASAANIVISELSYNPSTTPPTPGYADPNDFEYIELLNISSNTVDLSGCEFTAGISYHFNNGNIRQLAPGARLIIAENPAALAARHGGGLPIAGAFELNTGLSNGGERITLVAADGTTIIKSFEYKDGGAWPVAADGGGFSLVLIAPLTNPNHDQAESWRVSAAGNNGTPGTGDNTGAYATWKTMNGIASDLDTDGDGYANVLEYVLGTNPNGPGAPAMSAAIQTLNVNAVANSYFTFTFTHAPATDDVTWRVEMSPDLTTWSSAPADIQRVSLVVNGNGSVTETWRSAAPVSTTRHFARIFASTP
jgi:hypothetical protein